jgi:hypothetical protein
MTTEVSQKLFMILKSCRDHLTDDRPNSLLLQSRSPASHNRTYANSRAPSRTATSFGVVQG